MNKRARVIMRSATSIGALLLAGTSIVNAGAFALREQSAYGQGSSFAGVAAGGSLSSAFWNPATMSQVMGYETEQVVTGIFPISDVTTSVDGDVGDIGRDGFVPAGYNAYRWNENLVLGVSVNGPFGLRTKYPMTSNVRNIAGTSEVFSVNVTPMASYSLTDSLSIGAGVQIQYLDVRLTDRAVLAGVLEGDDIGVGFTAGIQWRPMDGTEIGLGFRSAVEHDLDGDYNGLNITVPGIKTPEMVSLGVRQRINDAWTAMATVEWTNWSRISTFPVVSGGATLFPLAFEYNDGWFASIGAEYAWNDYLTLRGGVGYEWSPIDNGNRTFRLPDNDRLWLSLGGSYKVNDRISLDLGYSYLLVDDTVLLAAQNFGISGSSDGQVHIISGAFTLKLDHLPFFGG